LPGCAALTSSTWISRGFWVSLGLVLFQPCELRS